jgi:two-component system, NarL family, invasion response regulator UvrY
MMIRALVADDHAIVRQGLKQILMDTPDIVVAGEAARGEEVLDQLAAHPIDVVLLDITMPGRSGFEVLQDIRRRHKMLPVLILSAHPEELYGIRALKAGASGYLMKERVPEEIVTAVRKVATGGKYIHASLAETLVGRLDGGYDAPIHHTLSTREYEVMCHIAQGFSMKEIAEKIGLSIKTISTYRSRILEKLKMKTNAQLVHYAIHENLLS